MFYKDEDNKKLSYELYFKIEGFSLQGLVGLLALIVSHSFDFKIEGFSCQGLVGLLALIVSHSFDLCFIKMKITTDFKE